MNKIRVMLNRGMRLALILCFALIALNELVLRKLIIAWFPVFSQNTLHILNLEIAYEGFVLPALLAVFFVPYFIVTMRIYKKDKVKEHEFVHEVK